MSTNCKLCPAECGADRTSTRGVCGAGEKIGIAKYGLHPYEEPCISCKNGSGTVFFSGCALRCAFCQNYEISHENTGKEITEKQLAAIFAELEERGAENINLVTAAHYVPALIRAFKLYRPKIPVVWNTHSYEKAEALRAIDPYIDVYLPDLKYFSPKISARYTGRADYFRVASEAVAFMAQRKCDVRGGKMYAGCIVRHLVLPLCANDSIELVKWFLSLGSGAYFSLMGQYTPCGNIDRFPELQRRITSREYKKVEDFLLASGCENIFLQALGAADEAFIPDFSDKTDALF